MRKKSIRVRLQVFHCFKIAEQGGETVLVDGFKAARILKEKYPKSYECLKTTPVEWQYISNQHHYTCTKPIINTYSRSDEVEQIRLLKHNNRNLTESILFYVSNCRYNIYDRSSRKCFSKYDQGTFYSSLKRFKDIVNEENMQWKLQLTPGTILFINNWRVLHGRTAFKGTRVLAGCYMGMNALLSKARILKLII